MRTQTGEELQARAAVITLPPSVVAAGLVVFEPDLPASKCEAVRRIPLGSVVRIAARLKEPASTGGWVLILGGGWWTVRAGSRLLTGWIGGPAAAKASGAPFDELLARVTPALPWLEAPAVDEVAVADWGKDPYALGAYSYPRVGALGAPAVWAEPVCGTLFFAGEATCGDVHPATVHGAFDSGVRAAHETIEALGSSP